jgi:protein TonB
MTPGLEPAFASGRPVWPLAATALARLEPDDPDLAIPRGALEPGYRDSPERTFPADPDGRIGIAPAEPLGPKPAKVKDRQRKWKLALLASCIFHASVALFFLQANDEQVLMEGAESSGIAFLGNAPDDQVSAGDVSETGDPAVSVTMITMLEAKAVETVEAEAVPVEETVEAAKFVEAERAIVDTLEPVADAPTEPAEAAEEAQAQPAEHIDTVAAEIEPAAPTAEPLPASPAAEFTPEILATDRLEPVEDDNLVPKQVEVQPAEHIETSEAPPVETAKASPVEAAKVESVKPKETRPVEAEPKPEAVEEKPAQSKPAKQAEKKPAAEKAAKKAAGKAPAKAKAGSGGRNQADTRRGVADGQADGRTAQKSKGGKRSGAGNAAISNYPGKVASKLRRTLRYPAEAKRQKLRGEVQVGFVVSAAGGVGSIRVVSSSGSPVLDKAALETVRRAAPFPAIPANAGRSNWPFTVPLNFSR